MGNGEREMPERGEEEGTERERVRVSGIKTLYT